MMMRLLFFSFFTLIAMTNVQAEVFCFGNAEEYAFHKDKMPKLFQQLPLVIGAEDKGFVYDIYAILRISIQSGVLILASDSWRATARYSDTNEVKEVCFDTIFQAMKVKFTNGKKFEAKYTDTQIEVPGAVLKRISAADQARIIQKIQSKAASKSGAKDKTTLNSGAAQ